MYTKTQGILFTVLLLNAGSIFSQQSFTIAGKLPGLQDGRKVMLSYMENGTNHKDSSIVKKGAFKFTGKVTAPTRANLALQSLQTDSDDMTQVESKSTDKKEFYLENIVITVSGQNDIKTARIKGGKTQNEFVSLQAALKPLEERMSVLSKQDRELRKNDDQEGADSLRPQFIAVHREMSRVEEDFIRKNGNSFLSADLLHDRSYLIELEHFEPLYNSLSVAMKNSRVGKKIQGRLDLARKTAIGRPAMEFTQLTAEDKAFSLSSLKGKYVLLDFWASWCGPCREENPNVVKAYDAFKGKNFEIVAVSLDSKKEAWLEAIDEDGLTWLHVSDLKGWKNEVALMYGINAVPQSFLLDPDGVIIARDLSGEDLLKKLNELIK